MPFSPLWLPWRAAIGLGLAGVLGALATHHAPAGTAAQISDSPSTTVATISEQHVAPDDAPPAPRLPELAFTFQVDGTTYVQITDFGERMPLPKHGKTRFIDRDGEVAVIAPLRAEDLVASHRAWLDRTLDVEGCTAHVTGFALVARLTGEASYAIESPEAEPRWTTAMVLKHGARVLAAQLDTPCNGLYARDAARPAADVPEELSDADLAKRARRAVIASAAAGETQKEWNEFPDAKHWVDHATIDTRVLRHPRTHETFVIVHAHNEHGCGDPAVNIIGTFRVLPDRTLAPIAIHRADMETIDRVIDVDNDGTFELVGRPWLGLDEQLTTPGGELLESLELPFFGCPC